MAKKKATAKGPAEKKKDAPGITLEKIVARIQQMMDPASTVTHDEKIIDRVGNRRQYDVVIRGEFGGRPVLGVMECKDHSRKKGPDAVEGFAKKTENLGANLRIMVSKKGFTEQALTLAKHENIGCLSLLPEDPKQVGFSIGDWWYGICCVWQDVKLLIPLETDNLINLSQDYNSVRWMGKPVVNWFYKKLNAVPYKERQEGECIVELVFDEQRGIEIEGKEYPVKRMIFVATCVRRKKRKWIHWSGDAFYDWHTGQFTVPAKGMVVGSPIDSNIFAWPDYDGEISVFGKDTSGFIQCIMHGIGIFDDIKEEDVPDLESL
jgi:hypothetical protein